jgi:hypothetical protein
VAERLKSKKHEVAPLDFDVGQGILDRFVDMPPYSWDQGWINASNWKNEDQAGHLKLVVDGFPTTCFGMIARKMQ